MVNKEERAHTVISIRKLLEWEFNYGEKKKQIL